MADDEGGDGDDYEDEPEGGGSSRTISAPTGNARTIAGMMAIAMIFSVISAEIKTSQAGTAAKKGTVGAAFSEPFIIIAGGTVATALLSLIADTGDTGRKFGLGMAGLVLVTALLVNGGPVWTALDNLVGGKPTGGTTTTKPTTAKVTTTTGATS